MSAWYIFSAVGFYPVDPISGKYVIGAPQVPEIILSLPNGNRFTIKANRLSEKNKYVKAIHLNGKPIESYSIKYEEIMKGGLLEFQMTNKPR
jgi:putative alpha-1,2-mannosidase